MPAKCIGCGCTEPPVDQVAGRTTYSLAKPLDLTGISRARPIGVRAACARTPGSSSGTAIHNRERASRAAQLPSAAADGCIGVGSGTASALTSHSRI